MDVNELQASLQALMDQDKVRPQNPRHEPEPAGVLVATAPDPDPYEHYFVPVGPIPNQFDDHLLEDNEEAGDVKITNAANAAYRAKRTGYQGLIASVLVAVGGVLTSLTVGADIDWKLLGLSAGQAVLTAVISFLHNDKSAGTSE
ncbi:hypothetical protein SAMN05216275_10564 [Streptosporangium canum]|uniref:Uncharacterized protein n=1 Tax=Streptosporangium canum TaxID=324952 RepID=A0A1I3L9Y2_9ACTN|nr:hypothetical protein [Streptosporangium canum]SFI81509.1 hypothetical protein SAMN05216275_10564 [Streptosporangium canum]